MSKGDVIDDGNLLLEPAYWIQSIELVLRRCMWMQKLIPNMDVLTVTVLILKLAIAECHRLQRRLPAAS